MTGKRDDRFGKGPRPSPRSDRPDRQPARIPEAHRSKAQTHRKPAKSKLPAVGPRTRDGRLLN
jgi:hypothetical protein